MTITASKDAPLGDYSIFLDGGHPFAEVPITLRLTEKVDVPEFPNMLVTITLFVTMAIVVMFSRLKVKKRKIII